MSAERPAVLQSRVGFGITMAASSLKLVRCWFQTKPTFEETNPCMIRVGVTRTTAGSVILRIPVGAAVSDIARSALAIPVLDDTTIDITPVTTLTAEDIVVLG